MFRDVTKEAGIHFVHAQGSYLTYLPETSSPGVGMIDIDGDGYDDLFFVQGSGPKNTHVTSEMPPSELYRFARPTAGRAGAHVEPGTAVPGPCSPAFGGLARPAAGRAGAHVEPGTTVPGPCSPAFGGLACDGRFEECGAVAGLDNRGWAMSCLVWDYDNDGYPDLYVTAYGEAQRLYHNNGDGTFVEVAREAGLSAPDLIHASSLTAIDMDRDGWQEVYVGQYLDFRAKDFKKNPKLETFGAFGVAPETLVPGLYKCLPKRLFRNRGDGLFVDVTAQVGAANPSGRTYGAVSVDLDGDGWPDIFVANDASSCVMLLNVKGCRFKDTGGSSWLYDGRGSMGVAVGDYDLDGKPDLVVTHWNTQPGVYRNFCNERGRKIVRFLDRAPAVGIGQKPVVGWAVAFLDIDNDSLEDLLQINGDTNPGRDHLGKLLRQPAYLWRMTENQTFAFLDLPPESGDPVGRPRVGRAAAFGDLDHDGYVDVAVGNNNEPAELWMSRGGENAWVGFLAAGTRSNRDALGLHLTLTQGKRRRVKQLTSGESFFSANSKQLLFGLGNDLSPVSVLARWPSGLVEEFRGLEVRRYHRLVEGTGVAVGLSPVGRPPKGASR